MYPPGFAVYIALDHKSDAVSAPPSWLYPEHGRHRGEIMRKLSLVLSVGLLASTSALAGDYIREKWFDYPDPTTAPKVTVRCVKEASADVPCPTWDKPLRMCTKSACVGHAYETELLRVEPTFVVTGPESGEEGVKKAVQAIVAVCTAKAIAGAKGAAAATPSPEPAARVGAGLATGITFFKACIAAADATAVVAGILNQLEFRIDTPTHWAKL